MIELLAILAGGLFLILMLIGFASFMHGFIKPVVDWMYPPLPTTPGLSQPAFDRGAWLEMVRDRKRQRLQRWKEIERDLQRGRGGRMERGLPDGMHAVKRLLKEQSDADRLSSP